MRRKIELFMVLFLLMGAIVASWKLSELATNNADVEKGTEAKRIVVIDPGHGASQLRQN